eukprot:TRINITY_DN103927_c0_g1_i1.p1 TRINITY_DN103927_c0_g1~~TRINITY_DN103927_c0_g1_i1.p1  ORF type:complete len:287 (+),score=66.60 TRINITY_DN103927_c0_g1_i1:28-888(+)
MEFFDLESGLKRVASGGFVLSCQETSGLEAGLALLKRQEQFHRLCFWGKMFGQTADYYIAFGLRGGHFEFPTKHFFFATKDFQFSALATPSAEEVQRIVELCGDKPLVGVPSTGLEPPKEGDEEPPAEEGEEGVQPQEGPKKLTEVDRLAMLVQEIDFDTSVVPRGAYTIDECHTVVPSRDFKGLSASDALTLTSYVHFRAPVNISCLRTLARKDAQCYNGHILDGLDCDAPKGCWAVRKDPVSDLVTLRSLSWPGYISYHVPETSLFGGVYFGHAQKEIDLPFLL